jgi:MFS family permease
VLAGVLLGLATISDPLVYLTFQQRTSMSTTLFPLLYAGTAIAYVVLAVPCGRLADKVAPARVFMSGQCLLLVVYSVLALHDPGGSALVVMLASMGIYYAMTDGVLSVIVTTVVPRDRLASGLGLLGVATALSQLAASSIFGYLWSRHGLAGAVGVMRVGMVVVVAASFVLLRPLLAGRGGQNLRP